MYEKELEAHGRCTIRRLAERASILNNLARKMIDYHESGIVVPYIKPRGHSLRRVGSLLRWEMKHHAFLYDLYCDNKSMPVDGYVEEVLHRYGIYLSKSPVERWFQTIGPFKDTMRVTSRYSLARNSWTMFQILQNYLDFILIIGDHSLLLFSAENPMKEVDVYRLVRRDHMPMHIIPATTTSTTETDT